MAIHAYRSVELQADSGSPERLQMANLNGRHHRKDTLDEAGNDSDGEDEGERVLLGSGRKQTYIPEETTWLFVRGILVETIPTMLFTTVGVTFTGELLERVAKWRAIERVNELYILIPMINSLKGTLEMNLSSRLSTSANIGELDDRPTRKQLMLGNLSLLQVQALLVSAVAATMSFLLGLVISPKFESSSTGHQPQVLINNKQEPSRKRVFRRATRKSGFREFGMVLSTSMASASLSGIILGSFVCALILVCRRWRRNPDNITPPIASCLSDLLTLSIVGLVSSVLVRKIDSVFPFVLLVLLTLGAVLAVMVTWRNGSVRHLIFMGWTPLLGAMIISSGTGMVLDHFVDQYKGYGLLTVVIGGLPGAAGSVLVSRLSTSLHASPLNALNPGGKFAKVPRTFMTIATLFLVTLPVQGLFLAFINGVGWTKFSFLFIVMFVVVYCAAVLISLTVAKYLTEFLWRRNLDPDVYAMAIQTSIVDLSGQLMLVLCFKIAHALGANVKLNS